MCTTAAYVSRADVGMEFMRGQVWVLLRAKLLTYIQRVLSPNWWKKFYLRHALLGSNTTLIQTSGAFVMGLCKLVRYVRASGSVIGEALLRRWFRYAFPNKTNTKNAKKKSEHKMCAWYYTLPAAFNTRLPHKADRKSIHLTVAHRSHWCTQSRAKHTALCVNLRNLYPPLFSMIFC